MVELLLQITRAEDDRLHGTARLTTAAEAQAFSGMLELMRVLEELVPGTEHLFPRAARPRVGSFTEERNRSDG